MCLSVFYYPMTHCNRYNNHMLQIMMAKWEYHGNKAKTLVDDLRVLSAPIPCRRERMMDRNRTIQLRKALNCIREENNKIVI